MSESSAYYLANVLSSTFSVADRKKIASQVSLRLGGLSLSEEGLSTAALLIELQRGIVHEVIVNGPRPLDNAANEVENDVLLRYFYKVISESTSLKNWSFLRRILEISTRDSDLCESLLWDVGTCLSNAVNQVSFHSLSFPNIAQLCKTFRESWNETWATKKKRSARVTEDVPNVEACIYYCRTCSWIDFEQLNQHFDWLLLSHLLLVTSKDEKVAVASLRTSISILRACNQRGPDTEPRRAVRSQIWSTLFKWTSDCSKKLCSDAFSIWLCLISCSNPFTPSQDIVNDRSYWAPIHTGLAVGTQEQRKLCLSILSMSVAALDYDVKCENFTFELRHKAQTVSSYNRFGVVFETIVLGRYLNQVRDCITDLNSLTTSSVHKSFMFTLLSASISHGMQDSIRKLIGVWFLENGRKLSYDSHKDIQVFLSTSFLPWAMQGHLFVSSTHRDGNGVFLCNHGDQLQKFIQELLINSSSLVYRQDLVRAILAFLISAAGHIFPYSRAYLLEGILGAADVVPFELDIESLGAIEVVASTIGFADIVRDMNIAQCAKLSSMAPPDTVMSANLKSLIESYDALSRAESAAIHIDVAGLDVKIMEPGLNLTPSDDTVHPTEVFDPSRLRGRKLYSSLIQVVRLLERPDQEVQPEHLAIIRAICEETEIQGFPKKLLMLIPAMILHPACLRHSTLDENFKTFIAQTVLKLQSVAQHRIYAFTPLAHAVRRAVLSVGEGASFFFTNFVLWYTKDPPLSKVEFDLELIMSLKLKKYVSHKTYESYYGQLEGYGHACVFDMLNHLPGDLIASSQILLDTLLRCWTEQPIPVPVFSKWKKAAQLQTMLLLYEHLIPQFSSAEVNSHFQRLIIILSQEPLPRYRFLLEWILARLVCLRPEKEEELLHAFLNIDPSNPKHSVSIMKIASMIACLDKSTHEYCSTVVLELVKVAANPKIIIRHEAQWLIPIVVQHCREKEWNSITDNPAIANLDGWIRSLETFHHPPPGRIREQFDLEKNSTMSVLIQGEYLQLGSPEREALARENLIAVETALPSSKLPAASPARICLGSTRFCGSQKLMSSSNLLEASRTDATTETRSMPLQTKSMLQTTISSFRDEADLKANPARKPVIVVASLIENMYNLGGLSRISEIFGAQTLYVGNRNVLKSRDFMSVAVSSDLHLHIEELEVGAIPNFLIQQKLDGWTIVGVEQTDSSKIVSAGDWQLPEKTVLVIGGEQKGIPARLLAEMDLCLEIQQFGVTRSMNVQTAAAIVLHELATRHGKQGPS